MTHPKYTRVSTPEEQAERMRRARTIGTVGPGETFSIGGEIPIEDDEGEPGHRTFTVRSGEPPKRIPDWMLEQLGVEKPDRAHGNKLVDPAGGVIHAPPLYADPVVEQSGLVVLLIGALVGSMITTCVFVVLILMGAL